MIFCFFARGPLALFLLIKIAPVVLDAADGRHRVRRHLYQVQATFASDLQRLKGRQNSKLLTIFVNDADFSCANAFVDAIKDLDERLSSAMALLRGSSMRPLTDSALPDRTLRTHPEYSIGLGFR